MVDPTSRYAAAARSPLVWIDAEGREIRYLGRRFLEPVHTFEALTEVRVQGGERLDLIVARTLGSADAWWRVADANETIDPAALTAVAGARVIVPVPRP